MKRMGLVVIVFTAMVFFLSPVVNAGKKICKLGHVNSPASIFQFQALEFKKAVEAELPNVEIQVYPAGQLGSTDAMIQGLQLNSVQIYTEFPTLWGDIVPEFGVFAVHFLWDNIEEREAFGQSELMEKMNQKLIKKNNTRIIGHVNGGGTWQFLSNKPIRKISDIKGVKNRCPNMSIFVNCWSAYGAKPTPLDFGEVYTGLATGVVEGVDNPMLDMADEKFYEVTKYLNMFNHLHTLIAYNISDAFWKTLSAQEQAVFRKAIEIANEKAKAVVKTKFDKAMADMKKKGIEVIQTDTADFRKAVSTNIEKVLGGDKNAIALYRAITQ